MSSFKDSQEAAFQRLVRSAIRKGDFTKSQRDVIMALTNHWFHHRAKGPMHPGRDKIAKNARVSVRTVASVMASMRAAGVLVPVSNLSGGHGTATRYRMDVQALMILCGCDWLDDFLHGYRSRICTVTETKIARLKRAEIAHGIYNVGTCLFQDEETGDSDA